MEEFSFEIVHLGLDMLKKPLDDSEFLHFAMKNDESNVVSKVLDSVAADPSIVFIGSGKYKELIETLSGILIKTVTLSTVDPNIVPKLLVKKLLECDNIAMGYILMDLWGAWTR